MWQQINNINGPVLPSPGLVPFVLQYSVPSQLEQYSALSLDSYFEQLLANMVSTKAGNIYKNSRKVLECVFFLTHPSDIAIRKCSEAKT
jgi:hypothetical protein